MNHLYRLLPSIDSILNTPQGAKLLDRFGHSAVVNQLRNLLQQARLHIQQHQQLPRYLVIFRCCIKRSVMICNCNNK